MLKNHVPYGRAGLLVHHRCLYFAMADSDVTPLKIECAVGGMTLTTAPMGARHCLLIHDILIQVYSEAAPDAMYAIYKHTRKFRVLQYPSPYDFKKSFLA